MKREKRSFLAGMLTTLLVISMISTVSAISGKLTQEVTYNNIGVILNGERINLVDSNGNSVEPFMYNNTNYLPVRVIAEALGLSVSFDNQRNSIILTTVNDTRKAASVVRTIDGDTIVVNLDGKEETIRLIGVDTPESVHPDKSKNSDAGVAASQFTEFYLSNQNVELEFDVQERDKYGRILAYVYTKDGMFNEKLLETGYASVATFPPNVKYVDRFTDIVKNRNSSIPSKNYQDGFMEAPSIIYTTSTDDNKLDQSLLYLTGEITSMAKTDKNIDCFIVKTNKGHATITNTFNRSDFKELKVGDMVCVGVAYTSTDVKDKTIVCSYVRTLQVEKKSETNDSQQATGRTVYVTKTGSKYHFNGNCNGGTYYKSTLSEARSRGLTACSKCAR